MTTMVSAPHLKASITPSEAMKIPHNLKSNVVDLLLDAVCVVGGDGHFIFISAACERIFGYPPEEMVGKNPLDFVHPDDKERTQRAVEEILGGAQKPFFENRYLRKDGTVVHIMWSAQWSASEQMRVAVARDITEQKHAESIQSALYAVSQAANAAEDLVALFQRIHEVVDDLLPADNFSVALYCPNSDELSFPYHVDQYDPAPQPQRLTPGTLSAEVVRSGKALLLSSDEAKSFLTPAQSARGQDELALAYLGVPLESVEGVMGALAVRSYSPTVRYTQRDQELLQFVSTQVAAAVERKRIHARLQYLALHDQLTDLPNRALFSDRLQTALARSRREHTLLALLYLDMDKFKEVNDNYGHTTGDHLLREVALRLRRCVRESDTVGRLGGDEFVVLLDAIEQTTDAALVAEKILLVLSQPYEVDGVTLRIVPSVGTAVYPDDGLDDQQLIRAADAAMYRNKKSNITLNESCPLIATEKTKQP